MEVFEDRPKCNLLVLNKQTFGTDFVLYMAVLTMIKSGSLKILPYDMLTAINS